MHSSNKKAQATAAEKLTTHPGVCVRCFCRNSAVIVEEYVWTLISLKKLTHKGKILCANLISALRSGKILFLSRSLKVSPEEMNF